jgi:rhomboid-like protein
MKRFSPSSAIVAINVAVFLAWTLSNSQGEIMWMAENFLVSWNHLEAGHWWVLISSVFSHNALFHLMINMLVLKSFAGFMERLLGNTKFLIFYLIAGLMGSIMHAVLSLTLMDSPETPALGASGAVAGVILLFSLLFPQEKLLIMGIIPIRAIWGAIFLIGLDLWGLYAQAGGGGLPIGHGAHLGGAMIGIIYYLIIKFQRSRNQHSFTNRQWLSH